MMFVFSQNQWAFGYEPQSRSGSQKIPRPANRLPATEYIQKGNDPIEVELTITPQQIKVKSGLVPPVKSGLVPPDTGATSFAGA